MPAPPVPAAEAARLRAHRLRLRRRIIGIIFGIPLLLLACALYLYFGPKPPPPPQVLPVTPQRAAQATEDINAVRQALTEPPPPAPPAAPMSPKTNAALHPTQVPPSQPTRALPVRHIRGPQGEDLVTMQLSEADINAYFSGNKQIKASLEKKGVHAVSVELQPPAVMIFHVNATLQRLTGNGLVSAALSPDPQTAVHLTITDARFGRLPPPVVKAAADQITQQVLARPRHPLPISVKKIEVQGNNLILTGVQQK